MWPAEGALSTPFLKQIGEAGFQWTASSHGVLKHSADNDARTNVAWLPPDGGAPRVVIRVIDPLGARQAEASLTLDAALWRTAPPPGQSRILLR